MTEWEYAERILYVDLTTRDCRVEATSLELKRSYVGGAGFVARLLASPERPAHRVVLAAGPLSDGMAGRLSLGAWRGTPVLSSLGGRMAAALKGSGFDAIVVDGRLAQPCRLIVGPSGAEILGAAELAGLDIPAAEAQVGRLCGPAYGSIILGPAAQAGHPQATLAHEGHYAGGSGVGAELGATGLLAVSVWAPGTAPGKCTGCTLACPGIPSAEADAVGVSVKPARTRRLPAVADLLGTCRRTWQDRPGQVLKQALASTHNLLAV